MKSEKISHDVWSLFFRKGLFLLVLMVFPTFVSSVSAISVSLSITSIEKSEEVNTTAMINRNAVFPKSFFIVNSFRLCFKIIYAIKII